MSVFICGDSTAAAYNPAETDIVGWGQALAEMMPEAGIRNHAMAGRSTKTFLAEGRLDRLAGEIRPGDLMLIQFGHNDEGDRPERHTEPRTEFRENLKTFLRFARDRGARPVLMTPICIRDFEDGRLLESHGEYKEVVRELAREEKVPLIDLYRESRRLVTEAGEEGSKAFYLMESPDPAVPGRTLPDHTHTRRKGAEAYARAVREALEGLGPEPDRPEEENGRRETEA